MVRSPSIKPALLLFATALIASSGHPQTGAGPGEVLLELEPGEQVLDVVLTPDLAHWVAITTLDNEGPGTGGDATSKLGVRRVIHDGNLVGKFKHVPAGNVKFSPDGSRMAFVAVSWGADDFNKYQVHVDGKPLGETGHFSGFVELGAGLGPWFSPDGSHVAWPRLWKNRFQVVRDGKAKPGEHFDRLTMHKPWTLDGRLAYVAGDDEQESVFRDGEALASAPDIRLLHGAAGEQGTVLRWIERHDDGERLVEGDKRGDPWPRIEEVAVSADETSVAFIATDPAGRQVVVADGELKGRFDEVERLSFGPGGELAFLAREASSTRLIVGGVESPDFSRIERYEFLTGAGGVVMVGRNGSRRHLIGGDLGSGKWTELGSFARVYSLRAGPGGTVAASVEEMGASAVFLDGHRVGPETDEIRHCSMVFTPGSLAFAARRDDEDLFVLDGDIVGSYERVFCPVVVEASRISFVALVQSALVRVGIAL